MKYANLIWQNTELNNSDIKAINVGDNLQFLAVEYLYQFIGIPKDEIKRISLKDLVNYEGEEKLILPLNWALFDPNFMVGEYIKISDKIIPVFLGMTLGISYEERFFNEHNISYLKQHQPIGCRDEKTLRELEKRDIKCYLNGCITALLPTREISEKQKKVFFIDAPSEMKEYIPQHIKKDFEILTQQCYLDGKIGAEEVMNKVKKHYCKIAEEAKIVITSRLHVAAPCIAMGIPVILAKKAVDSRFEWLEKYIDLYSKEEFNAINWYPQQISYPREKEKILNEIAKRIKHPESNCANTSLIHKYYMDRTRKEYVDFRDTLHNNFSELYNYINREWKSKESIEYSLWGINKATENLYAYILKNYPHAKLVEIIDKYKSIQFNGIQSIKPEQISADKNVFRIVLAVGATKEAQELFENLGMDKKQYFIVADTFIKNI